MIAKTWNAKWTERFVVMDIVCAARQLLAITRPIVFAMQRQINVEQVRLTTPNTVYALIVFTYSQYSYDL